MKLSTYIHAIGDALISIAEMDIQKLQVQPSFRTVHIQDKMAQNRK